MSSSIEPVFFSFSGTEVAYSEFPLSFPGEQVF